MAEPSWKKGRGKLGIFQPLLGSWQATADTEMGTVICDRAFTRILEGKFVTLQADWQIGGGKSYSEHCVFGPDKDGLVHFWSFTSDGKRSEGWLSSAEDIHPQALCFEADMDAGRARQIYWPGDDGTVNWTVESKTKKGWNRFVTHSYRLRE